LTNVPAQFVSFEVASEMAHFRRPYAITTALTFPIPPRTALCGLVGAILGLPKNACLDSFRDDQAVFGLQLVRPFVSGHVSINLLQTKGSPSFRPLATNPRSAMRYEIIRCPHYRILFSHPALGRRLIDSLKRGESYYTPCLGLAWMIAWIQGEPALLTADSTFESDDFREFVSPVRTDDLRDEIHWDPKSVYQRVRMPAEMQPDRRVTRYQEYIIDTTGRPIRARLNSFWRLVDGTCFSAM
jgi:CRISPR-associated protein Cas5h